MPLIDSWRSRYLTGTILKKSGVICKLFATSVIRNKQELTPEARTHVDLVALGLDCEVKERGFGWLPRTIWGKAVRVYRVHAVRGWDGLQLKKIVHESY